jgi:hypothetical protein
MFVARVDALKPLECCAWIAGVQSALEGLLLGAGTAHVGHSNPS